MTVKGFAFSSALAASKVVKAAPGNLLTSRLLVDATAPTAVYYLQLLNRVAQGANGAFAAGELLDEIEVNHTLNTDSPKDCAAGAGIEGTIGLVWVLSTTSATLTAAGAYLWVEGASFI